MNPWKNQNPETERLNQVGIMSPKSLYSSLAMMAPFLFLAAFLLFSGCPRAAHAYPSGECKSLDAYYKNVNFTAEEFYGLDGAAMFAKERKGQLIKEQDEDHYYVIWNSSMATPATQFRCVRVTGGE